ncbi:MAG: hypothetical protein FWG10_12325 [Eubacteriaceae bacterium]|nr:hypothetical protein [Eubacteriaceae bacterium]
MTGREIYQIWAPARARWVEWARPVHFVAADSQHWKDIRVAMFSAPPISYVDKAKTGIAIILDLPAHNGILEGIALAKIGFRPIPIYNGTNPPQESKALIDNHTIASALAWGGSLLADIELPADAPPVFLLDSNRTHRHRMDASDFDNSWDVYGQDMPSAQYFLDHGINTIIVRAEKVQRDLMKLLFNFQSNGINVFTTNGSGVPKRVIHPLLIRSRIYKRWLEKPGRLG